MVRIIATNVAPRELLWRPNRRACFDVGAFLFYNCIARMQWRPEPAHGAKVAAATNVLFDQSKITSGDLHRQTDSQIG